jgi:hypothetical protein
MLDCVGNSAKNRSCTLILLSLVLVSSEYAGHFVFHGESLSGTVLGQMRTPMLGRCCDVVIILDMINRFGPWALGSRRRRWESGGCEISIGDRLARSRRTVSGSGRCRRYFHATCAGRIGLMAVVDWCVDELRGSGGLLAFVSIFGLSQSGRAFGRSDA